MTPICHHICIQTNTYEASKAFYMNLLGFELEKESPQFHGRDYNTWLKLGAFRIELQTPKDKGVFSSYDDKASGIMHFCLLVDSVAAVYQTLVEKGFKDFKLKNGEPLYHVEGGLLLKIKAPEGTIVEFRETDSL